MEHDTYFLSITPTLFKYDINHVRSAHVFVLSFVEKLIPELRHSLRERRSGDTNGHLPWIGRDGQGTRMALSHGLGRTVRGTRMAHLPQLGRDSQGDMNDPFLMAWEGHQWPLCHGLGGTVRGHEWPLCHGLGGTVRVGGHK
jgi:hypothetical protein